MEKIVTGMGRLKLNPNAAEFIPAALKQSTAITAATTTESLPLGGSKQGSQSKVLSRTDSDDERRQQYWKDQLPDDIIPDFSINSEESDDRLAWQNSCGEENGGIANDASQTEIGNYSASLDILIRNFPGFAAQSLADILMANGGDLFSTFEMLTQLELQDDFLSGRHGQSQSQIQSGSQNINLGEFPALADGMQPPADSDTQQAMRPQRGVSVEDLFTTKPYGSGGGLRGAAATDFAAAVRKNTTLNPSSQWEQEKVVRPERLLHTGEYPAKFGDKFGVSILNKVRQPAPVWLETGEAVGNMYSDLREEARDHARVRNAYFEQARQAYLSGNKALARDLSAKGQMHNGLMKDAHSKAGEAIFQQRNVATGSFRTQNGQCQLLDLHGLHVSEAIPRLKRELAALRASARSSHQQLQVLICVGTGHHTKGSRTPARLPIAVEKFLAEDECLPFTEQQPGMLMVVLG